MSFDMSPWGLRPLREICERKVLVDPKRRPDVRFRYIDISSVSNETFSVQSCSEYAGSEAPSRARQHVRVGDVLFATTRPYLRNVALVPMEYDDSVCSTGFCVLRASAEVVPEWLFFLALSDELMAEVTPKMRGANYPAVSEGDVLGVEVPVPPLAEQRRIVSRIRELLTRADEIRRLRDENQTTASALLPALLREQFNGLDERYPTCPLGQVTIERRYGTSEKSQSTNSGTPILRIPNVADRRCNFDDLKFLARKIDKDDALQLRSGDLLIVRTNGSPDLVGRCAVVPALDRPYGYASYLIRFRLDEQRVRPKYASYFLSSTFGRDQIARLRRTSAGQYNINSESLQSISLPLPPLAVQDALVDRMDRIDASVRDTQVRLAAEASKDALLPAAILRKAFAGEF